MYLGLFLYISVALLGLLDLALFMSMDIVIEPGSLQAAITPIIPVTIFLLAAKWVNAYLRHHLSQDSTSSFNDIMTRILVFAEGMFLIRLVWFFLPLFHYLSMASHFPYADAFLTRIDQALPVDWTAYYIGIAGQFVILLVQFIAYNAFTFMSCVTFFTLVAFYRTRQAEFFLSAYFFIAFACILIGMFFPANGPVDYILHQKIPLHLFADFIPGVYHIPYIEAMREAGPITLKMDNLKGLVCFPSFHTAGGIIMAWSLRRTRIFWPMTIYAAIMISSTPTVGGHYFIDVLGGAAVAVIMLLALERLPRYRSLFCRKATIAEQPSSLSITD